MDAVTLIVSLAAVVAIVVVLSRVLTWLFKFILIGGLMWFVATQVDFADFRGQIERWTKKSQGVMRSVPKTIPWSSNGFRRHGSRDESVGL